MSNTTPPHIDLLINHYRIISNGETIYDGQDWQHTMQYFRHAVQSPDAQQIRYEIDKEHRPLSVTFITLEYTQVE